MLETQVTEEELTAVTIVFHQYETGLREGTIYTMVGEGVAGSWNYSNLSYSNFTMIFLCIEKDKKNLSAQGVEKLIFAELAHWLSVVVCCCVLCHRMQF